MAVQNMWWTTVIVVILAAGPNAGLAQTRSGSSDTVWVANGCAAGRTLQVVVRLAKKGIYKALYRTVLTICRRERSQIAETHWPFSFKPSTSLVFSNDSVGPDESVLGDIWQAGGESDALELGVSLELHKKIVVNTVHVASADAPSRTPVADGLVVETLLLPPINTGPQRRP